MCVSSRHVGAGAVGGGLTGSAFAVPVGGPVGRAVAPFQGGDMDIERVSAISPERFERDYLRVNHPVVVTDALADWNLAGRWTPGYFRQEFGHERVQVYNNYFDLQSMSPLDRKSVV